MVLNQILDLKDSAQKIVSRKDVSIDVSDYYAGISAGLGVAYKVISTNNSVEIEMLRQSLLKYKDMSQVGIGMLAAYDIVTILLKIEGNGSQLPILKFIGVVPFGSIDMQR